MPDTGRLLNLAKEMISANSENPPGYEKDVAAILKDHLESEGLSCRSVGSSERPNLIFSTNDDAVGPLVIHGHMDTVPAGNLDQWSHDPFKAEVVDGRLYGRGACDMKGPLAALAETMILYSEKNYDVPLVLLCTSDEESGCSGAEVVADSGFLKGVKYGVCAEPTGLDVLVGEKGMLWTKVAAHGKAAHGSRPGEGRNAILLCQRALDVLTQHDYHSEPNDLLGQMTINIGMIQGGVKINVVPDYCEASIDMRTVAGQTVESIMDEMNQVLADAGMDESISIEYVHGKPAVITPDDALIVRIAQDVVASVTGARNPLTAATYGTDCSVLQPRINILNVICGPGSIEQAHQPDEYIQISQLEDAVNVYLTIAERVLQEKSP